MTVLPVRSTREAPDGAVTAHFLRRAVIRPSWTTNAPPSRGALPSPVIKRPPSYRTGVDAVRDCEYVAVDAVAPIARQHAAIFDRRMRHPHHPTRVEPSAHSGDRICRRFIPST